MKKRINVLLILMFALVVFNTNIYAKENDVNITKVPYSQEYEEWLKLPEEVRENTIAPQKYSSSENEDISNSTKIKARETLPTKYNTLDYMNVKVKNQGIRGLCWAFSLTTAMEIACNKYENEIYEFSPLHIDYSTVPNFKDRINPFGIPRILGDGGNYGMSNTYLTSGQGPILEEYMKYDDKFGEINSYDMPSRLASKNADLDIIYGISSFYKRNIKNGGDYSIFEMECRNNIKSKIIESGSVMAAIHIDDGEYYNKDTASLFYDNEGNVFDINHQITLIGYDDNYSAKNFNSAHMPKHDGAYIALNSWGNDFGKNGIFYISYDDLFVEEHVAYIKKVPDVDYDNMYQMKSGPGIDYLNFSCLNNGTVLPLYTANIFQRDISKKEKLSKIYIPNNTYWCSQNVIFDVYVNPKDSSLDPNDLIKVECDVNNLNVQEEYINLNTPIELTGDKFAIVIKYTINERTSEIKVAVDGNFLEYGEKYSERFASLPGESLYSNDCQTWNDLYECFGYDYENSNMSHMRHYKFPIKAYTTNEEQSINIVDVSSDEKDIICNRENDISAYVTATSSLNNSKLNVQLFKEGIDVTDKIEVISLPKVKSRASDIKIKSIKNLEKGRYTLRISTDDNIAAEKEFEVVGIEDSQEYVKIEYEDDNFINALCENCPEIGENIIEKGEKCVYLKKELLDNVSYIGLYGEDSDKKITSLKGIEKFENLTNIDLWNVDLENLNILSNFSNLKGITIYNSGIEDITAINNIKSLEILGVYNVEGINNICLEGLSNLFYLELNRLNISEEDIVLKNLSGLEGLSISFCNLKDLSKLCIPENVKNINFSYNKIYNIPQKLFDRTEYISLLCQDLSGEYVFEKKSSFELIELPDIFKGQAVENLILENCEYDAQTGKIKINTENLGQNKASIEMSWPENWRELNEKMVAYGSKCTINYIVEDIKSVGNDNQGEDLNIDNSTKEENNINNENTNNPKTGDVSIYICLTLVAGITINIITLKSRKFNEKR